MLSTPIEVLPTGFGNAGRDEDEGRVGGLGKEGILVNLHVLGTEILDQSRIDYHSSRSEGTRFGVKASTKFAANLCGYLLVIL